MRSIAVAIAAAGLAFVPAARGQTTGVPFINDYTIACTGCATGSPPCFPPGTFGGLGGASGSTSCTTLWFDVSAGGTFTFTVTCASGSLVWIFIDPCPCTPCWAALPPVCGLPFSACGGTTNQSIDLNLGPCPFNILFSGLATAAGVYTATITLPPLPPGFCFRASTQALIAGTTASCSQRLVTQAYDLTLGG